MHFAHPEFPLPFSSVALSDHVDPSRLQSEVTHIENRSLLPENPLVSVCIVTYNQEHLIRDAIDSALYQNFDAPYEIIVGDDFSTDGTRAVLRRYQNAHPDRVRLNLHDEHYEGITARKNMVENLSSARGKYIALLDGDDYWISTNKLQTQVACLESNPEVALTFHDAQVRYENDAARKRLATRWSNAFEEGAHYSKRCAPVLSSDRRFSHREMIHGRCREGSFYVPASSVMFRRASFSPVPDWYWKVYFGDKVMQIYLSQFGETQYHANLLSCRRFSTQSVSTKPQSIRETNLFIQESHVMREVCPHYNAYGALSAAHLWQMRHWLAKAEYGQAWGCFTQAVPNYLNFRFQQLTRWVNKILS